MPTDRDADESTAATGSRFEPTTDRPARPSVAVVRAVADRTGREATGLPPLYDAIDPEALDALFTRAGTTVRVSFRYAGHVVTVSRTPDLEIDLAADGPARPDDRRPSAGRGREDG